MTPEQINAAVAKLDGYVHHYLNKIQLWRKGDKGFRLSELPDYYYSADCVIPLLEKHTNGFSWRKDDRDPAGTAVVYFKDRPGFAIDAPTFAAAACAALLKSVGVNTEEI